MLFHSFSGGMEMKGGGGGGGGAPVDDYEQIQQQRQNGGGLLLTEQQQQRAESCSDEADSRSSDGGAGLLEQRQPKKQRKSSSKAAAPSPAKETSGGDGATVEMARRRRGRPPGSKNKPKPPVVITDDDPSSPVAMRPHVIEIPAGQDVVDALSCFSRRRDLGLCVLAGTGIVSNVVLRHPSPSPSSPAACTSLSFIGHFEILSISATFFPPSFAPSPPTALPAGGGSGGFSISLAGPHGQVFGGMVAGSLTASGTVTILAATFCNPTYHRLPAEDDVSVSVSVSVSGGDLGAAGNHIHTPHALVPHQRQQQQHHRSTSPPSSSSVATAVAAVAQHHHYPAAAATVAAAPAAREPSRMSMYTSHLPSDVIWPPTARSPPY